MANPVRPSYRLNLNRNPTQKWAEAQQVDYDGDDWGDDDDYDDYRQPEPVSAGPQRHPGWAQTGGQTSQRSFTNPSLALNPGRSSLDREDERRHFSAGNRDPRYPSHPTATSSFQQALPENIVRGHANSQPLQLNTQIPSLARPAAQPSFLGSENTDAYGVPHSAPAGRQSQRTQLDTRTGIPDIIENNEPDAQQDSGTGGPSAAHVTGKGDFSQQQSIPGASNLVEPSTTMQPHTPFQSDNAKPLPFIRPADIYKRMEEEREKERRSQESPRPSIDSASGKVISSPVRSGETGPAKIAKKSIEEPDPFWRAIPNLDTATERRDEYGPGSTSAISPHTPEVQSTSNFLPTSTFVPAATNTSSSATSTSTSTEEASRPQMTSRAASSVYTDHVDPPSASTPGSTRFPAIIGSGRNSTAESYQQSPLQASPVHHRLSGIQTASESASSSDEDLPNFDQGVSSNPLSTVANVKPAQMENPQINTGPGRSTSEKLEHQPFPDYTSVGHQTFDAQNDSALSPSGTNDIRLVSNSSSTPDISPTIGREPGTGHDVDMSHSVPGQRTPEESGPTHGRSESIATIKASGRDADHTTLPAKTFVPGYGRDKTPLDVEESNAQRPLSVEIPAVPEAQHGVLSAATASSTTSQDPATERLPSTQYAPDTGNTSPVRQPQSQKDLAAPSPSRTASEDWQDWQAQRQQFKAKHGIQDSNTASPAISSPVSRAESPAKGTVRDIAERLESNSGSSSPVNPSSPGSQNTGPNKPPHLRNESFRPILPGGWQSYTTNTSGNENAEVLARPVQKPLAREHSRTESTDSVPTATAPRTWQSSSTSTGPVEAAFAAAAAAGSAMVGAFSGRALTHDHPQYSEDDSDDDDSSRASLSRPPGSFEARDFALASPAGPRQQLDPKTILEHPEEAEEIHNSLPLKRENPLEFPAPLRMSRIGENKQSSPRLSVPSFSSSGTDQDPEQLQHDIVQSLTPKTSSIDEKPTRSYEIPVQSNESAQGTSRPISAATDEDDVLQREHSPYWDDRRAYSKQPTSSGETSADKPSPVGMKTSIPVTTAATDTTTAIFEGRPFLEQRYSWENGFEERGKDPIPTTSDSTKGIANDQPSTPTKSIVAPPSVISPPIPTVRKAEDEISDMRRSGDQSTLSTPSKPGAPASFPQVNADFRDILAFKDSSQRIRAFDENRNTYAEPSHLLEQWLSSMNTPEHAEVFRSNRLPRAPTAVATPDSRPSPRREMTNQSSTKQMQEDGKRLFAAAGKIGGKAGTVAKGFFSKGKDKLRTASSSDKVPSINRRSSSNIEINTSPLPRPRESVLPERAPQIPTPSLDTPIGEPSWSMLSSQIDHMFDEETPQPYADSFRRNIPLSSPAAQAIGPRNYEAGIQNPSTGGPQAWTDPIHNERPPTSVLAASLSGNGAGAKTQEFPNYHVGSEMRQNATQHGVPANQDLREPGVQKDSGMQPRVSIEDQRLTSRQRVDSLPVPRQRRPSSVSDVSEISVVPDETSDVIPRNVSPALENQPKGQTIPTTLAHHLNKEGEARQNRSSLSESTLPAYSSTRINTESENKPRVAPGAQIVPVAELKPEQSETHVQGAPRPFSFVGSETLNHALSQQNRLNQQSGVTQQASNDASNRVDMEKTPQPSITEHPAYRSTGHNEHTGESGNPLPSSRRSPQDLEQARQHQQIVVPQRGQGDEGYRIPGPYVQEYRSPRSSKPTLNQDPSQSSNEALENSARAPVTTPNRFSGDAGRPGLVERPSQIESRPDLDRSKSKTFGDMFRSKSRSRSRDQPREAALGPAAGSDYTVDESRKRPVQDAGRARKLSFDMLRGSGTGSRPQLEGTKKRSSGFGALFSLIGGKDTDRYKAERNASVQPSQALQQNPRPYNQPISQGQQPASNADLRIESSGAGQSANRQYAHTQGPTNSQYANPGLAYTGTRGYYGAGERHPGQIQAVANNWQNSVDRPLIYGQPSDGAMAWVPPSSDAYQPTTLLSAGQPQIYGQPPAGTATSIPQFSNAYHPVTEASIDRPQIYGQPSGERPQIYGQLSEDKSQAYGQRPGGTVASAPQFSNTYQHAEEPLRERSPMSGQAPVGAPTPLPQFANAYQPARETYAPPASASPPVPVTRASRDISYGQDRPYVPPVSPRPQHGASTAEPKTGMADHVKNLHKRSRSPRLGRPPSDEHLHSGQSDPNSSSSTSHRLSPDPANQLGTFTNKKISPGGGVPRSEEEQEKPWTIGLPDSSEDDRNKRNLLTGDRGRRSDISQGAQGIDGSNVVSPTTPHQQNQGVGLMDVVSPMTAVEPRDQGFNTTAPSTGIAQGRILAAQHSQPYQRNQRGDLVDGTTPIMATEPQVQGFNTTAPSIGIAQGRAMVAQQQQSYAASIPHPQNRGHPFTDTISPVTAVEPEDRGFAASVPATSINQGVEAPAQQPHTHAMNSATEQSQSIGSKPVRQLPVPLPTSSAGRILDPNPQSQPQHITANTTTVTPQGEPSVPPAIRNSRDVKQAIIERKPDVPLANSPSSSRPLTVAEKVMGIQPAARGTLPEHRSTTPVLYSPAPLIGAPSKSTTWPDQKPSTTGVGTTNTTGTPVTTTMMRGGSKPGKGGMSTSTYVMDSQTPSRAGSNAVSIRHRDSNDSLVGVASNVTVPLSPVTTNTSGNRNLPSLAGSKHSTNGAGNVLHGKSFDAVELPGSRPDGYESEEEIVMSATAYPGQEWMPEYAIGANWDD